MIRFIAAGLMILSAVVHVGYSAGNRVLLLKVSASENAWAAGNLERRLIQGLSRRNRLQVVTTSEMGDAIPAMPEDCYNLDTLVAWGCEVGGRYLMIVDVEDQRLERRKSWHLPLVAHKYRTYGVIEGELRLLDLVRGKLLTAEDFCVDKGGPQIFQASFDDDIGDPDLHLTAPQKIRFFDDLEKQAAEYLIRKVAVIMQGR